MATITQEDVLSVLKRIAAPDGRGNVVSAGLVSDIAIQGGTVMFALTTLVMFHIEIRRIILNASERVLLETGTATNDACRLAPHTAPDRQPRLAQRNTR